MFSVRKPIGCFAVRGTNHPVTFGAQALVYSSNLVREFKCDFAHGLRLGALLRGRIPEGTLLLPPKRLPLLDQGGEIRK